MTASLTKLSAKGQTDGTVDVPESVFGITPNAHVMYLAVKRQMLHQRLGSANSKTRSEVRGGGRKPWKQKGTGRARAGSIRSPLWVGGGVIFGPKPRKFSMQLPKKVRALSLRSALSARKEQIRVVEDFSFLNEPKTKLMAQFLKTAGLCGQNVLILADYKAKTNQNLLLAARNIPGVTVRLPHNLSVMELLNAHVVLASADAIEEIGGRYSNDV